MIRLLSDPISVILRVDHAGEAAAVGICQGQRYVLEKSGNHKAIQEVKDMEKHEQEHHAFFQQQLSKHQASSTALLPLWKGCSWALGAVSAILGQKASMLCVEAVEEVIVNHYNRQLIALEKLAEKPSNVEGMTRKEIKALIATIKRFRDDEEHHRAIAKDAIAKDAIAKGAIEQNSGTPSFSLEQGLYRLWKETISVGCVCAITLSERI